MTCQISFWSDILTDQNKIIILSSGEGFDQVTIPDKGPEAILNGLAVLESTSESDSTYVQEQWESGHYVISRQSHTFFMQQVNNCTHA